MYVYLVNYEDTLLYLDQPFLCVLLLDQACGTAGIGSMFSHMLGLFFSSEDMYAQESIDLLTNSGIQFKKHEEDGIDVNSFAELLMTSGIVLNEQVKWLSFHR